MQRYGAADATLAVDATHPRGQVAQDWRKSRSIKYPEGWLS